MIDSAEAQLVRENCLAIARDFIGEKSVELKTQSLELVGTALEMWKLEQASADGTVDVGGASLARRAGAHQRLPRPASEVEPWRCGGVGIRCNADLFARLAYGDGYPLARRIEDELGSGVAIALLLEQDAGTMSIGSLMQVVRYLWMFQRYRLQACVVALKKNFDQVRKHDKKFNETRSQRLAASAVAAEEKRRCTAYAHAEWRAIASRLWHDDIRLTKSVVAGKVIDELVARGFDKTTMPRPRTIGDALDGVKATVKKTLERMSKRVRSP